MNNQKAQNIQELWDNLERCNTHVLGIAGEQMKQKKQLK